jgi:hypothetical protein
MKLRAKLKDWILFGKNVGDVIKKIGEIFVDSKRSGFSGFIGRIASRQESHAQRLRSLIWRLPEILPRGKRSFGTNSVDPLKSPVSISRFYPRQDSERIPKVTLGRPSRIEFLRSPEILVPKDPNGISASFWKTRQLLTAEASQKHPLGMQCETTFLSQLVGEVPSTGFICESTVSSKVARWAS